jgi:KGK domain
MIMNDRFESLESGEVISVQHDTLVLSGHRTFRVGELNEAIESHLKKAIENWSEENNGWFTPQGLECEALRFGSKGWQKGRIRLCLEFCPDEPNPPAHGTTSSSQPTGISVTTEPIEPTIEPTALPTVSEIPPHAHSQQVAAATDPTPVESQSPTLFAATVPLAGITAMGTVAVAAIATPVAAVIHPVIPHADTTLEPEEQHVDVTAASAQAFDEIAFDFDFTNNDLGTLTPNGMMELDLTDLSLDFSEHDLLNFEDNGISDGSEEFINLQDLGKLENSGMLIDEVWNELNQGNWTGSN